MHLTLRDVGYVYSRGTGFAHRALEGVSVSVKPGEMVLVLGSTGSGKSTLLRVTAGLLQDFEGRVELGGAPVSGPFAEAGQGIGMVFQNPESQLFAESVLDDVAFGPRNQGRSPDEVMRASRTAIETVGLSFDEFASRSPFTLSGGEARRVALAGVLAMNPMYLLLDEPTAGLDVEGRRSLRLALEQARRSTGVLVVTHDAEEFLDAADKVLILEAGRTAFYGDTIELLKRPCVFAEAGLREPEVLRTQVKAREAGIDPGELTLAPGEAAARLIVAAQVGTSGGERP
ncbi:MAG: ATP-binding cassette domain-containing protein [Coriobacteriia bacterium]|nr:ATP-binding cassette domain-containing protein [Coriobacteriia bacterium]